MALKFSYARFTYSRIQTRSCITLTYLVNICIFAEVTSWSRVLVRKFQIANGPSPTSDYLQILQFLIYKILFSDFLFDCIVFHFFLSCVSLLYCCFHINARVYSHMYMYIYLHISQCLYIVICVLKLMVYLVISC